MKVLRPFTSVNIITPDRAGRAPYNFVPLAREPWKVADPPPPADRLDQQSFTGELEMLLTLKTDFYTRGMWSVEDYRKQVRETIQPLPYMVGGKVRIPGSSLRGMVRTLIEILSFSPIGEINNSQMFFRSVASVADPNNARSFEPQAAIYKKRLLEGPNLTVKAGYLYGKRGAWTIHPAQIFPPSGKTWHRYRTRETWLRREVRFTPEANGTDNAYVGPDGREQGWLVCSGGMNGKQKQWIVRAEDTEADPLTVNEELVEAYKENGVTKQIRAAKFEYTDQSQGLPCFYVTAEGQEDQVVAFGHTAYMRMPYRRKPKEAIPPNLLNEKGDWDFVTRLFGRVSDQQQQGARGRVFFEDAHVVEEAGLQQKRRTVLGQPQPTTYQHYVVQQDERVDKSISWDGDKDGAGSVCLRGHKMYWHRPAGPPSMGTGGDSKDTVATEFQPVKQGTVFRARIRFENLADFELGALISSLALPPGCAHKLGMAKPLGFGSVHVAKLVVKLRDAEDRYSGFFADPGKLKTGDRTLAVQEVIAKQDAFAVKVLGEEGLKIGHLWAHPRLAELRALLTLGDQQHAADWLHKTRYLEFGRPTDWEPGRNYNEYNEVGHPDKPRRLSKRRPLPPASQVIQDKGLLPHDPRPFK